MVTKGYVCVFVCFSTQTFHLEATSDLTTETYHIHSDSGETFVGASTSLSKDFIEATRSLILSKYSLQNVLALQPSWRASYGRAMGGRCQKLEDTLLQADGYREVNI